jgi:hypothetical protein
VARHAGHTNHKQKILYVAKLKEEIDHLKLQLREARGLAMALPGLDKENGPSPPGWSAQGSAQGGCPACIGACRCGRCQTARRRGGRCCGRTRGASLESAVAGANLESGPHLSPGRLATPEAHDADRRMRMSSR